MKRRNFLALSASAALAACGGSGWGEAGIALPPVLRDGLNYCYYLSLPGQLAATHEHTNLLWHGQFYGSETLAGELEGQSHRLVLDCASQLFTRVNGLNRISEHAELALLRYFGELRALGILDRVAYLVPMDEPNMFCSSEGDLLAALAVLKKVAAAFRELDGVKFMCIYGSQAEKLYGLHEFDVVGINNYKQQSEVLTRGAHADLMKLIAPHQQVMVIPGAAYYQDPAPFVAYAHTEPRCWGVVPFIWCHVPESANSEGWKGLEVQTELERDRYRAAGRLTLNRT